MSIMSKPEQEAYANVLEELQTSNDSKPSYDFEFITQSLGLIPIHGGSAAINTGAVTDMERDDNGGWVLRLQGEGEYTLNDEEMAELEQGLRNKQAKRKELIRDEILLQNEAGIEAQNIFSGRVAPGKIINVPGMPKGNKFRQ